MQVYKSFFRILYKNKGSMLVYLIVFVGLCIIFMNTSEVSKEASFKDEKINVGIVNQDDAPLGNALEQYIKENSNCVDVEISKEGKQKQLFYREIAYILTIPKGFSADLVAGKKVDVEVSKISASFSGSYMDRKVNTFINSISTYIKNGCSDKEAIELTQKLMKQSSKVTVQNDVGNSSEKPRVFYYFAYYAYIVIVLIILGLGIMLTQINKKDIQRRIKVSALSHRSYMMQMVGACITFSVGIWFLMMLFSLVYIDLSNGLTKLFFYEIINAGAITVTAVGLAFLIGALIKNPNALNGCGNTFSLGFSFLGGVFVSQDLMDPNILKFSQVIPSYWYMKALNCINENDLAKASTQETFWKAVAIQVAFGLACFSVALAIRRVKLKEK